MSKKIALVGHCGPDSSYLRIAASKAGKHVAVSSVGSNEDLAALLGGGVDLLLVNRQLDGDFPDGDGVELIRRLRSEHAQVRTMLISNYPDAQAAAVAAGALPGFGKRELGSARVTQLLRGALELETSET